jgi:AraC-like DNA-binding protein
MPGSATSTFSEPEDFEAALGKGGCLSLLITGRGQLRAQLTVITLHRLRLSAAEEQLSRIAFIAVPANMVITAFSIGNGTVPVRGGVRMHPGEIMILPPGEHVHVRTEGLYRWGSIWIPARELVRYGSALTGAPFALPPGIQCWLPPTAAGRSLRGLHRAAIRMAQTRPQAFVDPQTAYALEQQLIEALVECLSAGSATESTRATQRGREIMVRFESLIQGQPDRALRATEICAALRISKRLLRKLCTEHLGMSPTSYVRLRRMLLVHRALRRTDGGVTTVSKVARRYGFRDPGRLAGKYRSVFGEFPSATLRRGSGRTWSTSAAAG